MSLKEQPAKMGFIAAGVASIVAAWIYDTYFKPTAPTGGLTDITAMLMNIAGVVSIIMGAFTDLKKAIPQEAFAAIRKMLKEGHIDVGAIIAIAPTIDINAILEAIKKIKGGIMPPIKIIDGGNAIIVDPDKHDTIDARTDNIGSVEPYKMTDADRLHNIVHQAMGIEGGDVKVNVTVGDKAVIDITMMQMAKPVEPASKTFKV